MRHRSFSLQAGRGRVCSGLRGGVAERMDLFRRFSEAVGRANTEEPCLHRCTSARPPVMYVTSSAEGGGRAGEVPGWKELRVVSSASPHS